MDGEIIGPLVSQVFWVVAIIVVLSLLAFLVPYIVKKIVFKERVCTCGYRLKKEDGFCPKCGKRVMT